MGKCQCRCQFSLTKAEVGGADGGVGHGLGLKGKQQSNNNVSGLRSPNAYQVSIPSPNLIRIHSKLTSQTNPALSLAIKSTRRQNESVLHEEEPLTVWSAYDHKAGYNIISLNAKISWLFKLDYRGKKMHFLKLFSSIHFLRRENKWVWLKAASFWKLSRNNAPPCNYSG